MIPWFVPLVVDDVVVVGIFLEFFSVSWQGFNKHICHLVVSNFFSFPMSPDCNAGGGPVMGLDFFFTFYIDNMKLVQNWQREFLK